MSDFLNAADIAAFTSTTTTLTDAQVAAAHNAVRQHCRWHVVPERTETITADGDCGTEVTLPTMQITGVTEIRVDGVADADVDWWRNGRLRRSDGFTDDPRSIEVDLTHGFDIDDAPLVVAVVAALAERIAASSGGEDVDPNIAEEAIGSYRVRYVTHATTVTLTESERMMLDDYRWLVDP